jgi:hypothetical protein
MKRNFKIVLIAAFLFTAPLLMLAQSPPHPNGGVNGPGGGPVGGGAPIGGGVVLLVALGVAYGARKLYVLYSKTTVTE